MTPQFLRAIITSKCLKCNNNALCWLEKSILRKFFMFYYLCMCNEDSEGEREIIGINTYLSA